MCSVFELLLAQTTVSDGHDRRAAASVENWPRPDGLPCAVLPDGAVEDADEPVAAGVAVADVFWRRCDFVDVLPVVPEPVEEEALGAAGVVVCAWAGAKLVPTSRAAIREAAARRIMDGLLSRADHA
jgi:hypothetical protein